jgi:signal peptidase II
MIAIQNPRLFFRALAFSAVILVLDQVSKEMVLDFFSTRSGSVEVLPFFNLVLVYNPGVSFGMLQAGSTFMPWVLTGVASLITLSLLLWLAGADKAVTAAALALVIGGATGNIIDRVRMGAVVDFLDFHAFGLHWPAFNVADSGVVCGAALLLLQSLVFDTRNRQSSSS